MTGELCDCFRTKAEGVRQFWRRCATWPIRREVRVYLVDGRFVSAGGSDRVAVIGRGQQLACARGIRVPVCAGRPGLLIDVGSTTTDIIPHCRRSGGRARSERYGETGGRRAAVQRRRPNADLRGDAIAAVARTVVPGRGRGVFDDGGCLSIAGRDCRRSSSELDGGWAAADDECAGSDWHGSFVRMPSDFAADDFDRWPARSRRSAEPTEGSDRGVCCVQMAEAARGRGCERFRRVFGHSGGRNLPCPDATILRLPSGLGVEASRCAPAFALAVLAKEANNRPLGRRFLGGNRRENAGF